MDGLLGGEVGGEGGGIGYAGRRKKLLGTCPLASPTPLFLRLYWPAGDDCAPYLLNYNIRRRLSPDACGLLSHLQKATSLARRQISVSCRDFRRTRTAIREIQHTHIMGKQLSECEAKHSFRLHHYS